MTDPICISYTSGEWFRSSSSVMTIMMEMNGTIEQVKKILTPDLERKIVKKKLMPPNLTV